MTAPDLKPCPFCGGEAERIELTDRENMGGSVICCTKCQASSHVEFGFKENLVASWNTRAPLADALAVKPLEWEDMTPNFSRAPSPLFGTIRLERYSNVFAILWSVPGMCSTFTDGEYPTLEAAKAAAQADYEARILSAIIVTAIPAQSDKIAEAARVKLIGMMPEIIAALKSDGLNVSLVADVSAALRAIGERSDE